jgi:outer membrane protein W
MTRRLTSSLSLVIALAVLAAPAFGQVAKDGELNIFFGVSAHTANAFQIGPPQADPAVSAKFDIRDGLRGGLRFNVVNNGHWGQEFFYSYERNEARYIRQTFGVQDLDIQVHTLGATGLFYFNKDEAAKTRPFLSFGIGATIYKPTDDAKVIAAGVGNLPGFGQSNELTGHYGVGFKHRVNPAWGIRVDMRHFVGRFPSFSMARKSVADATVATFPAEGAINNFEASAGLVFYFGR